MRLPGGQTCSVPAPVSLLGLVPTLLDLAGVDRKAMPVLHGTTLRPEHSKRVHAFRKALLDWMINTQNVPMPRGRKE